MTKERLVLNIVNYLDEYKTDFENSSFWKKNKNLLIMFYLYDFDKKPYTKDEFRVAMHLVYYKNYFPLKESSVTLDSTTYGRMADFYFTSNSSKPCKLVDEFFDVMCK